MKRAPATVLPLLLLFPLVALTGARGPAIGSASPPGIGDAAPSFSLPDTHGETHALEQYRGGWVVLQWLNYECPFTQKHYRTGNIPGQQEKWTGEGVVWLAIVSSAPGKEGHFDAAEMATVGERMGENATAVLLDPEGRVGRLYDARTTPHMFVIDPKGIVVYVGGIDDVPTQRDRDLERATQLVDRALTEALAGEEISRPTSRPYGCAVQYGG